MGYDRRKNLHHAIRLYQIKMKYLFLFLFFSGLVLLQALGSIDYIGSHDYFETNDSLSMQFNSETGFKGNFSIINNNNGFAPCLEGYFPDSLFVQKSDATKYRDYADNILEKIMPYLKVPREQIVFDKSYIRQWDINEVIYRQEIAGIGFVQNSVYIKFIFAGNEPNFVIMFNRMSVHQDLRKQVRITKKAAIKKMMQLKRDYSSEIQTNNQSNPPSSPKPKLVYAPHHPDAICWYAEWDGVMVLLDAKSGELMSMGKTPSMDPFDSLYHY